MTAAPSHRQVGRREEHVSGNTPDSTPDFIRRELERVAALPPTSGRQALAKTTALRTLAKLVGRQGPGLSEAERSLWAEDRDEDERVTEADWHPNPGTEFVQLDAFDTVRVRRAWWLRLQTEMSNRTEVPS